MASREQERRDKRDRQPPGEIEPIDPDLTAFVERQWKDQAPQKIEIYYVFGAGNRSRSASPLEQKQFKGNDKKPEREEMVELSNHLYLAAQRDCDVNRKPRCYGVFVTDERRSGIVGQFPLRMTPRTEYGEPGGDDDDEMNGDSKYASDRLLKRIDALLSDDRFRVEQFSMGMGDIFKILREENESLRGLVKELLQKWLDAVKQAADSRKAEKEIDLALEEKRFKLEQIRDLATTVRGLLPTAVNRLTGRNLLPEIPYEVQVLSTFIKDMLKREPNGKAQFAATFGTYDEGDRPISQGILTVDQARILIGVAAGEVHVNTLDALFAGQHAITGDQFGRLQQVFTQDQLGPLMAMVFEYQKKMQERAAASAQA